MRNEFADACWKSEKKNSLKVFGHDSESVLPLVKMFFAEIFFVSDHGLRGLCYLSSLRGDLCLGDAV